MSLPHSAQSVALGGTGLAASALRCCSKRCSARSCSRVTKSTASIRYCALLLNVFDFFWAQVWHAVDMHKVRIRYIKWDFEQ